MLLILLFLVKESAGVFASVGIERFFSDASWHPEANASEGLFNFWPMIAGTIATSSLAVCIATPIAVFYAICCEFYTPKLVSLALQRVIELLAGIPSVVFGLWGLIVLVPYIQLLHTPGVGLLAGALVLSLMILPTIALMSREALAAAAETNRQSAAALGLATNASVIRVFLPLAKGTIAVGVLLAAARAVGETMVVLMLCGNVARVPSGLFDSTRTLTATIALEMGYSYGDHRAALFGIGLLLMCSVLFILTAVRFSNRRLNTCKL